MRGQNYTGTFIMLLALMFLFIAAIGYFIFQDKQITFSIDTSQRRVDPLEIYESQFQTKVREAGLPVVVLFIAAKPAGPCRLAAHGLKSFSDNQFGKAKAYKIDIDKCTRLPEELNITTVPVFVFFDNGEEIDRLEGVASGDDLQRRLSTIL